MIARQDHNAGGMDGVILACYGQGEGMAYYQDRAWYGYAIPYVLRSLCTLALPLIFVCVYTMKLKLTCNQGDIVFTTCHAETECITRFTNIPCLDAMQSTAYSQENAKAIVD